MILLKNNINLVNKMYIKKCLDYINNLNNNITIENIILLKNKLNIYRYLVLYKVLQIKIINNDIINNFFIQILNIEYHYFINLLNYPKINYKTLEVILLFFDDYNIKYYIENILLSPKQYIFCNFLLKYLDNFNIIYTLKINRYNELKLDTQDNIININNQYNNLLLNYIWICDTISKLDNARSLLYNNNNQIFIEIIKRKLISKVFIINYFNHIYQNGDFDNNNILYYLINYYNDPLFIINQINNKLNKLKLNI
jgi:hypothetical protein